MANPSTTFKLCIPALAGLAPAQKPANRTAGVLYSSFNAPYSNAASTPPNGQATK